MGPPFHAHADLEYALSASDTPQRDGSATAANAAYYASVPSGAPSVSERQSILPLLLLVPPFFFFFATVLQLQKQLLQATALSALLFLGLAFGVPGIRTIVQARTCPPSGAHSAAAPAPASQPRQRQQHPRSFRSSAFLEAQYVRAQPGALPADDGAPCAWEPWLPSLSFIVSISFPLASHFPYFSTHLMLVENRPAVRHMPAVKVQVSEQAQTSSAW